MLNTRVSLMLVVAALGSTSALAQQQPPPVSAPTPATTPPPANAVAATVNGHAIQELAIYRALVGVAPAKHAEYRPEILKYLIDNTLVDQYLDQMKIDVDAKEIDAQIAKIKSELQAKGKTLEDVYSGLHLSEAELRMQLRATLRWDRFIEQYGAEKTLKEFFEANIAIFDGSAMRAKHILVKAAPGDPQSDAQAKSRIALLKNHLDTQLKTALAGGEKLDNLEKERLKMKVLDENFAAMAAKESACPTKDAGGDLGWFPRVGGGRVPEAFAKAAYSLKPWEMSDAVQTEQGYHLILCVDFKAGAEPKFEQLRELVRVVYADKMREAVVARMRPTAKIVVGDAPK